MLTKFSTPLNELPSFLSTISMVSDDRYSIIQKLRDAEQQPPAIYEPTRDLVLAVLEGKLKFDAAMQQAWRISDDVQRKCATQILDALRDFFKNQRPAHIAPLRKLEFLLPNGLPLAVSPVWIRQCSPGRLLILHLWQTALTDWQLSAAAAVLRHAISGHEYGASEIDFVSVPYSEAASRRRPEIYNWTKIRPLTEDRLHVFWTRFVAAWNDYHREGPRTIRTRSAKTLFDLK